MPYCHMYESMVNSGLFHNFLSGLLFNSYLTHIKSSLDARLVYRHSELAIQMHVEVVWQTITLSTTSPSNKTCNWLIGYCEFFICRVNYDTV